ncbi:MAG: ABC transporter permease [Armatimonadetes bacterium]|nr:ABC transporter permease [Armatimonadota bacterium]
MKSADRRVLTVAGVLGVLLLGLAVAAPGFFQLGNLRDLIVDNSLVLLPALGMTAVILCHEIDLSVGSIFGVCCVVAGGLAQAGFPMPALLLLIPLLGAAFGALNAGLVVGLGVPSMIATLATMVGIRGALQWFTQGAWVNDLPAGFQWFGLGQAAGQALLVLVAAALWLALSWMFGQVAAGRALYAVGADADAARLVGIRPKAVVSGAFVSLGALAGLAALLSSARFTSIQPSAGTGMELQVIACVVVGGTSILGGRGGLTGTLLGVALLGVIATTLIFLHVNPAWEKAIQGAIILVAMLGARSHSVDRLPAERPVAGRVPGKVVRP